MNENEVRAIIHRLVAGSNEDAPLDPAEAKRATPARLIDIIALLVGYQAYLKALTEMTEKRGAHQDEGLRLARRFLPDMKNALREHIASLMDRPDASVLRPAWRLADRGGALDLALERYVTFFEHLFPWFRTHGTVMRDTFTGRAYRAALLVGGAIAEDGAVARLSKLAIVPASSGVIVPHRWLMKAAEDVGAPVSDSDAVMADAESAGAVTDALRTVKEGLATADPISEEAAVLTEKKQALSAQIEEIVATSKDPAAVKASATAAVANQPESKVAKKAGLNEEQTEALLAEGHVVITAGAGSGKTRVLAAKVAYFVEEKGYRPEQILATSFTNKSAAELKERVEKMFGITDARIGTTHNIAGEIIRDFRPDLRDAMMAATRGTPDRILQIAFEQVKLSRYGSSGSYGGGSKYNRSRWRRAAYGGGGGGQSPYWKQPIGEWFNLGETPTDNKGRPVGSKRIKTAVGIFQAFDKSVEQAWEENKNHQNGDVMYFAAATYGAYEWLKRNDPQYSPCMDFNDWLTTAVSILQKDPQARDAVQRRFKVVMVDEAQDLNQVQHELFGLIAGRADTYCFIGDDAQAIYEFRGAVPGEFIGLPEKDFNVKRLSMNFRSGASIVNAGNNLIAHNEDRQIQKVCRADVDRKGHGAIRAVDTPSHEASGVLAADEIASAIETGDSPNDYGILVRNNAEADAFALALMSRGIPFRSKVNYFTKPAVQAIISWMVIAAGGSPTEINEAVVEAHKTPGFFLNTEFESGLRRMCPPGKTYLQYLLEGGGAYGGDQAWRNGRMVTPYADVLRQVVGFRGQNTETMVRNILHIQGSKETFLQSLIDKVDPDDICEENDTLEPTDEMIQEAALSPIKPLLDMAKHFQDPEKFLEFIIKMKKANEKTRKDEENPEPAVRVDTVHQWKGLEAKHVYVSMANNTFPHFESLQKFENGDVTALDSERRLGYVAITRGQDSVTILSPATNYLGKIAGQSVFVEEACIPVEGQRNEAETEDTDAEEKALSLEEANARFASSVKDATSFVGMAWSTFLAGGSLADLED